MAPVLRWIAIGVVSVAAGIALDAVGLPSSLLLAALFVGLAVALSPLRSPVMPAGVFRASQAMAGVALGTYLQEDSLVALADSWLAVALVSLATLGASLLAGVVLARTTSLDAPTAALGSIAGGASGIVGMAGELGADDRTVAFMQYLRVLIVVAVTPLGIALLFGDVDVGSAPQADLLGDPLDWPIAAALAAAGAFAAMRLRVTAGVLLGPMVLTGIVVLTGLGGGFDVPAILSQAAFGLIGLQVGLGFTPQAVRDLRRVAAPTLAMIGFLIVVCFGFAAALAATTHATLLDSYLATTPGGLYAVVAVAFGSGADTTFIVGVQSLRVIAMVLLAPIAVRWTLRRVRARQR
ncbi:AbrB family transcriptional regulator [Thermoleophilia bacterium SCSIO 60948]|nr:AbrB family transcriptional regulator [Thermoleophilia bacterium SCSIO 60948]